MWSQGPRSMMMSMYMDTKISGSAHPNPNLLIYRPLQGLLLPAVCTATLVFHRGSPPRARHETGGSATVGGGSPLAHTHAHTCPHHGGPADRRLARSLARLGPGPSPSSSPLPVLVLPARLPRAKHAAPVFSVCMRARALFAPGPSSPSPIRRGRPLRAHVGARARGWGYPRAHARLRASLPMWMGRRAASAVSRDAASSALWVHGAQSRGKRRAIGVSPLGHHGDPARRGARAGSRRGRKTVKRKEKKEKCARRAGHDVRRGWRSQARTRARVSGTLTLAPGLLARAHAAAAAFYAA
ncbi:hypothetical protein DFH11DRAFT_1549279 [Phellopilus nigrolimitatus]|nr:hypothetical protein DFH11DRAFT_1549279 [Phellopilus nigrolimitatus]